nr:DUF3795 domain-containing protein [uncultured Oscillibacter sp.]
MKGFARKDQLLSLCGLNCGLCTMRLGGQCPGCGGGAGNQSCAIARCGLEHGGVEYCWQCGEFPCGRYGEISAFDSFITHQNQLADMEKARRMGLIAYQTEQREKQEILRFLLETCNDGRRRGFFALAVNLLEPQELRDIVEQLETESEDMPLKEKAACAAALLQAAGDQRGIELKLRKKSGGKS